MSRVSAWDVWMVDLGEPVGNEQGGRRPAVVVASDFHAMFPIAMTLVVPLTARDRKLRHHVRIDSPESGLDRPSFARTEEITAISERRLVGRRRLGRVSPTEAGQIRDMVHRMIV